MRRRGSRTRISPRGFPALTGFLLGYLHEDFEAEHGSVSAALDAFRSVASATEFAALAAEWQAFRSATGGLPIDAVAAVLTASLGSAWRPGTLDELDEIDAGLAPPAPG